MSSPRNIFMLFQVSVMASSLFPCSFLLSEWVSGYMCLFKIKGITSYVVYFYFSCAEFECFSFQGFLLSVSQRLVVWPLG